VKQRPAEQARVLRALAVAREPVPLAVQGPLVPAGAVLKPTYQRPLYGFGQPRFRLSTPGYFRRALTGTGGPGAVGRGSFERRRMRIGGRSECDERLAFDAVGRRNAAFDRQA
jgi:hypothetical protein